MADSFDARLTEIEAKIDFIHMVAAIVAFLLVLLVMKGIVVFLAAGLVFMGGG